MQRHSFISITQKESLNNTGLCSMTECTYQSFCPLNFSKLNLLSVSHLLSEFIGFDASPVVLMEGGSCRRLQCNVGQWIFDSPWLPIGLVQYGMHNEARCRHIRNAAWQLSEGGGVHLQTFSSHPATVGWMNALHPTPSSPLFLSLLPLPFLLLHLATIIDLPTFFLLYQAAKHVSDGDAFGAGVGLCGLDSRSNGYRQRCHPTRAPCFRIQPVKYALVWWFLTFLAVKVKHLILLRISQEGKMLHLAVWILKLFFFLVLGDNWVTNSVLMAC